MSDHVKGPWPRPSVVYLTIPRAEPHTLTKRPQPMADQWMGECSCGWRTTVSLYSISDRDAVLTEIARQHGKHILDINAPDTPPAR